MTMVTMTYLEATTSITTMSLKPRMLMMVSLEATTVSLEATTIIVTMLSLEEKVEAMKTGDASSGKDSNCHEHTMDYDGARMVGLQATGYELGTGSDEARNSRSHE